MAINAYVGVMGSGKSYEVVNSVILPAVLAGRRVITNISGIAPDLIYERCKKKAPDAKLGEILYFSTDEINRPGFFPIFEPAKPGIVQPGDLVCVDEAWKFWDSLDKIPEEHMDFFRMHRHYVSEEGVSCDMSLMIQDMASLHRKVKAVVEVSFRMIKLKRLGFSQVYRVEVYEGHKLTKATRVDQHVNKYDKSIFPLYKSYKGGVGKELQIDSRQNIFKKKSLWFGLFILVLMGYFGWYGYNKFFHRVDKNAVPVAVTSVNSSTGQAVAAVSRPTMSEGSLNRIHGLATFNGQTVVIVSSAGRSLMLPTTELQGLPPFQYVLLDGQKVTK